MARRLILDKDDEALILLAADRLSEYIGGEVEMTEGAVRYEVGTINLIRDLRKLVGS
jgi:hypothetical protein